LRARLQVIGTSHVEAIRRAADHDKVEVINLDQSETLAASAKTDLSEPLVETADFVFLAIGGVAPSIYGLIESDVPFSVGDAKAGQIPEGSRFFIAEQLMRDFLKYQQVVRYERIAQLVERYRSNATVACIAPPPPRGESRDRGSFMSPDPYVRLDTPGRFRNILDRGFTPPGLRKKLYDIDMALFRDFCCDLGVDLIEAPNSALDGLGLLDDDFSVGDPVHGNARYGALVINQMLGYLAQHGVTLRTEPSNGSGMGTAISDNAEEPGTNREQISGQADN